jgi:hypothetical protein
MLAPRDALERVAGGSEEGADPAGSYGKYIVGVLGMHAAPVGTSKITDHATHTPMYRSVRSIRTYI